jgi:hypothetical protein
MEKMMSGLMGGEGGADMEKMMSGLMGGEGGADMGKMLSGLMGEGGTNNKENTDSLDEPKVVLINNSSLTDDSSMLD